MAEINRPDFFIVPAVLVEDKRIRPKDGLVYAAVYWFTKLRNEKCIASNKTIARVIGCDAGSVANALVRLSKYGYVQIRMDTDNHREEIIPLVAFSRIDTPYSNDEGGSSNDEGGVHQMIKAPSSNDEQNKNIEKEKNKNINPLPLKAQNGIKPNKVRPEENPNRIIANSANSAENNWREFFDHYLTVSGEKRTKPTDGRKAKLKVRLQTFTLEEIKQAVSNAFADDFYSGNNDRGWRADIDYFLRSDEVLDRLMRLKPRQKSHIII